jgi:hypothetical protein
MARKVTKKTVSKGERLGWLSINDVKSVTLSSIVVTGKRVSATRRNGLTTESQQSQVSFLIP